MQINPDTNAISVHGREALNLPYKRWATEENGTRVQLDISGDFIRSIESVNCSAVASGASNIATVVAYNERFSLALPAINNMIVADWETTGLVRIQDNSCLCITTNVGGTTPGTISGMITLIQG